MKFTSAVLFFHLLQVIGCNGATVYFGGDGTTSTKMVVLSRNQHKAEKAGGYACYVENDSGVSVESFRARGKNIFKSQNKATEGIWQVGVGNTSEITNNNTFGVFGCKATTVQGDVTYVSTVRIRSNASIVPRDGMYTKTVNIGDTGVTISMNVSGDDLDKVRWWSNEKFWETCNYTNTCENVRVDTFSINESITLNHSGIYECNFAGARPKAQHAMVVLIVRECPPSMWNPKEGCNRNCSTCLNGGHCNEHDGKCVCPPGFKGDNCSVACGGNRFGYECEKKCNPTLDCPDKCRGYLFCLNHPLGCRCGTGWKGLDCSDPCSKGTYGANCLQDCNCTSSQSCDRYTGNCQENVSPQSEYEETLEECACHEDDVVPSKCDDQCKTCRQPWYTETCDIGIKSMTVKKVNPDSTGTVSCILSERVSNSSYRVTLSRNGSHLSDSGISPLENTDHKFLVSNASDSDEVSCHVWKGNSSVGCIQRKLLVYELPVLSSAPWKAYSTETSITIKWKDWDPDKDYGEGPVVAYIPYYKNKTADDWLRGSKVSVGDKEPEFEATGLNNGTVYLFRVATVREGKNGEGRKGPEVELQPGYDFPWWVFIIAGGSLLILLFLMTLVFLGCYRRKHYQKSDMTQNGAYTGFEGRKFYNHYSGADGRKNVTNDSKRPDLKLALITKEVDSESDDDFSDDNYDLPSPEYQPQMSKPQPIRITEFHEYMKQNSHTLGAEFKLLKKGKQHPWTVGEREENKEKNRFRDLYAYDHSRVELKRLPNDHYSDYYNASFIKNQIGEIAFIAAQGPNRASLNDFWRMIWEQKVSTVAMVTNLFKGSKRRCSQYWPDKEGCQMTFNNLQVEWTATDFHSSYIIRTLRVSKNNQHHKVCQLHFLTWPDEGVPEHPTPFIEFVNRTKQVHADIKTPMLVHCSAGLGKTGTFIALYSLMDVLQNDIYLDVFCFVEKMRENRINMIQSPSEYIFLHKCLIEYHLTRHTEMGGDVLARIDVDLKGDILSEEFELVRHFEEEQAVHQTTKGGTLKNSAKNRFHDILPVDENIPNLLIDVVLSEDETYINATLVNSFRRRNAFITTQSPLPNTVVDFWRMVYDQKCPLIVMLNQLDPNDKTCPCYWPESGIRIFGKMTITCTSAEDRTNWIHRVFEVSHDDFKNIHEVHHLQVLVWPPEMSYLGVLQLIEEVETLQDDYTGTAPSVVHCIDGVGRCGVFVAVNSEMERLADTGKLNLFTTMKQLRLRNPHILAKWTDYYLCYKIFSCLVQEEFSYDNL